MNEESLEVADPAEEAEAPAADSYALLEEGDEFEIDAGGEGLGADYLMTLRAPPKRRLATHQKTLPTITESVKMEQAPPSPKLAALPPQFLPREVLSKRHAARLSLQRLPVKTSAVTEKRPVQMLPPLAPRKRAPQYRYQAINQEVIQPVVSIQPMLHERVLTRTIMQPTLQKQPVIQPIITQPVLTREIREQPITQQQIKYRNIVQTREVKQPQIREELKTEESTAPKQTVEAKGAPFARLTAPPKSHH